MKFLIVLILSSSLAQAETFLIEGTFIDFSEKDELLLKGCEKECEALRLIRKHKSISLKDIRKTLKYPGSEGSDVCHEVYKGFSLLGRNSQTKDQRAFCFFGDRSMVEINSLSDYLKKNKIVH